MGYDVSNPNKTGFSLFGPGSAMDEEMHAKNSDSTPHNASLFSQYTPEKEEEPTGKKSIFGHIGCSLAELEELDIVIDLNDEEECDAMIELLHAILPAFSPEMLGLLLDSELNLASILDRIKEIIHEFGEEAEEKIAELILEKINELKKKKNKKPRKLRFKILGNKREVGLAFEDDLDDENERAAAKELAEYLRDMVARQEAEKKKGNKAGLAGINEINPAATTTQRLTYQLSIGGGAMMGVLLQYVLQFLAPSIANTIAKGNPNLVGLITKFDPSNLVSSQMKNPAQNTQIKGSLWQNNAKPAQDSKGPEISGPGASK